MITRILFYFGQQCLPIFVLPDSELYRRAKNLGIIKDEISYLKHPEHHSYYMINITKMSDAEYDRLKRIIFNYSNICGFYPGVLRNYNPLPNLDNYGRQLWYIEAYCPHCNSLNDYNNVFISSHDMSRLPVDATFTLRCRKCTRRFSTSNPHYWWANPHIRTQLLKLTHDDAACFPESVMLIARFLSRLHTKLKNGDSLVSRYFFRLAFNILAQIYKKIRRFFS